MTIRLYGLTLVCAVGLMLVLVLSLWCLLTFRVNGPVYREIAKTKDVVADVLPPPMFIIEAYLVVQEADDTTNAAELKNLEDRFSRLQQDYERQYVHWKTVLPEGELKDSLTDKSYIPATEFFDIARNEYFPARHRGDREGASSILRDPLRIAYQHHRSEIDRTVDLARAHTLKIESDATDRVTFWMRAMIAISAVSVVALLLLIGKMRSIEEKIIQSEKLNTVAGLAAGMAHEINNPLAGVLQSTQVVLSRVSPAVAANRSVAVECGTRIENIADYMSRRGVQEMLEAIRVSGHRAAEIVAGMLSFGRKDNGQMLDATLAELLDETVELARKDFNPNRHFDFRDIQVVREYDPKLAVVPCRSGEIQQVVLNLLKNASQAMPDRGTRPDSPRVTVRTLQIGNSAKIEIEDNGPGMSRSMRRRVFEPFYSTHQSIGGSGLGLFVSYFIITRNHNGTIRVESAPGVGTKFSFTLPLVRRA